MPNLAANHPQIIHFAIVLLLMGVAFRVFSLTGKLKFTQHAATTLLLLGTLAAVLAVKSGTDAHGPVERIPGVRTAVQEHEELGKETKNWFLGVAALELIALGLATGASTTRYVRAAYALSALVGIVGSVYLYEASEHGGALVYEYAGGPGLRTGHPVDVERLLLAGLYEQSVADRKAGRSAESARLVNEMALRFPQDTTIRFLHVESLLIDSKDYPGALTAARMIGVDSADARFRPRKASLMADIFIAMGQADSARAELAPVVAAFPRNTRLKAKLDSIK
jgi:uncharacterized membrane protein